MKFRQLNFIRILKTLFFDAGNSNPKNRRKENPKSLLIVRMDAIGDYILFRNFLEIIRYSEKFKDYRITLCGNEIWRELAEEYDKAFIDQSIWINRNKFRSDRKYRNEKLKLVSSEGFEYAIETTTSRDMFFGDAIIKASNAKYRIGKKGDTSNTIGLWKFFTDKYYTRLIDVSKYVFEFESNKKYFEEILNTGIPLETTYFNLSPAIINDTIILFPGASEKTKQWSPENFAIVANYLLNITSSEIVIAGSKYDGLLAGEIFGEIIDNNQRVYNLCGSTSLPQLVNLIAGAKLLISSDTSAFHIGIASSTKVIGLFDGRHFGRFAPYLNLNKKDAAFLYPSPIGNYMIKYNYWVRKNNAKNLGFNINEIKPDEVIKSIIYLLDL